MRQHRESRKVSHTKFGTSEGRAVGLPVGFLVGCSDGLSEGTTVGTCDHGHAETADAFLNPGIALEKERLTGLGWGSVSEAQ